MKDVKKYYYRIGIIRLISCIMVFLYHLKIISGGYLAVCTFFTLSGYLSCISSLKNKNFSIMNYYKNILLKIYLPLITIVSLTLIVFKQFSNIIWLNLKPETLSVILGYNNFWQLGAKLDYFANHINSPFMHLWYIAILLQFDLIFPIVFKLFKLIDKKINKNISLVFVSMLTIIITGLFYYMSVTKDIMFVYYNSFLRSFSILFGVLLAIILDRRNFKEFKFIKKINRIAYIFYLILFIVLCIFVPDNSKYYALYMILTTLISVRLINYSLISDCKREWLNKIIKLLSKTTYEIYLIQYPIIFFIEYLVIKDSYKLLIIFGLTIIISYILEYIVNLSTKKVFIKVIKIIILSCLIIYGGYIYINEKDHTKEMKELENELNSNSKLIEEKNNNYLKALEEEQKEWDKELENMKLEEEGITEMVKNLPVVGIGDSVLLGASDALYNKFPNGYFDGKVSRSIVGAEDLIINLKNKGKLGNNLILALANNGDYSDYVNKGLMNILGTERDIYWVSAVKADDPKFNNRFKEFAKKYSNIHIVEWEELSKGHPEYFYADGIHLKDEGKVAYTNAIFDAIYNNYLKSYKSKQEERIKEHEKELKEKITFYGNNALINSFSYLKDSFINVNFNTKEDYSFDSLFKDLKDKINNNNLEYKIVLIKNKKANLNIDEYNKIIELCKDHKLYIVNILNNKLNINNDNVKIIDFYDEINNNKDYLSIDKIHLTKKGNEKLSEFIVKNID